LEAESNMPLKHEAKITRTAQKSIQRPWASIHKSPGFGNNFGWVAQRGLDTQNFRPFAYSLVIIYGSLASILSQQICKDNL